MLPEHKSSSSRPHSELAPNVVKVPSLFISGEQDWGTFQKPGAIDKMSSTMSNLRGIELVENAGHWVQQENSEKVNKLILDFLSKI